ncbi:unnamed protein product, partial [Closterium sp. Naga37s-1]
ISLAVPCHLNPHAPLLPLLPSTLPSTLYAACLSMLSHALPSVQAGIVAILDKLLCAHAHVFLAGSITCGGSRGFEQDITQHRSQFNKTLPHRWVSQTDKLLWQSNGTSPGVG